MDSRIFRLQVIFLYFLSTIKRKSRHVAIHAYCWPCEIRFQPSPQNKSSHTEVYLLQTPPRLSYSKKTLHPLISSQSNPADWKNAGDLSTSKLRNWILNKRSLTSRLTRITFGRTERERSSLLPTLDSKKSSTGQPTLMEEQRLIHGEEGGNGGNYPHPLQKIINYFSKRELFSWNVHF